MSDLRIQYNEEMVGAGHPTKSDTLNRLFLGGVTPTLRDSDGKVLGNIFKRQTAPPETGEGEVALFCQNDTNGEPVLFVRKEDNGDVAELNSGLKIAKVQELSLVAGHSVHGWITSDLDQTVEEVPEGQGVFITDSDYIYNSSAEQKYFRWSMADTLTARCSVLWTWDCNLCGSHTFHAKLLTLAKPPKKLHFAAANAFPITVPEFEPDKTIILRACGSHNAAPYLSDSVTLSSKTGLTGISAYQLGYYLIEP